MLSWTSTMRKKKVIKKLRSKKLVDKLLNRLILMLQLRKWFKIKSLKSSQETLWLRAQLNLVRTTRSMRFQTNLPNKVKADKRLSPKMMLKMPVTKYMKKLEALTAIQLLMQLRRSSTKYGMNMMSTTKPSWRELKPTLSCKT